MSRYIVRTLLVLCFLVTVGDVATNAQIDSDVTIEADIPNAFVVKDTSLPAGKYTIRVVDDTNLKVLEIRSVRGDKSVLFETEDTLANETPRRTELVFDKIGDKYFLSQIWLSGSNSGSQLEKTKMERDLEASGMKGERNSVIAHHRSSKKKRG